MMVLMSFSGNNSHNPLDVHVSSSALRLHDLRSVEPAHRDLERHASHSLFQGGLHPRTAVLERRSTTVDSAGGEVQDWRKRKACRLRSMEKRTHLSVCWPSRWTSAAKRSQISSSSLELACSSMWRGKNVIAKVQSSGALQASVASVGSASSSGSNAAVVQMI